MPQKGQLQRPGRTLAQAMFIYGCITATGAVGWFVWALWRRGFDIPREYAWLAAAIFAIYFMPFSLFPGTNQSEPVLRVTSGRITVARLILVLGIANILFWPVFAARVGPDWLFALCLPAMAFWSAALNSLNRAFGAENVFTPGIVRPRSPLVLPLVRLVRSFQPPEVSFEEWRAGMVRLTTFISNPVALRNAWLDGDRTVTTIEDYIEFDAEVFVILESDRCMRAYAPMLNPATRRAMQRFLNQLRSFTARFRQRPAWRDANTLLSSKEWQGVRQAAIDAAHSLQSVS